MPYKSAEENKVFQREWWRKKQMARFSVHICSSCGSKVKLTFGQKVLCESCLKTKNASVFKISPERKTLASRKRKAKLTLRRVANAPRSPIDDEWAYALVLCTEVNRKIKGENCVDIQTISKEIKSPALKQIAEVVVETFHKVEKGDMNSQDATTRLRVCRSLIQIMALERLRPNPSGDSLIPEIQ